MKGEVAPDPESLVAHREFVEALARRLVDDRHVAEDLAQETFLAALLRPPRAAAALRGFLAKVLRTRRARWLRDEERRLRRERGAAKPDRADGGADLVARLSWHRKVVDTLLTLEEPCRTTLLLRFYEDLKPKQIAERLGVPAGTVRARLSRGLGQMRARLDAEHEGDRRSWQLGLLPLLAFTRPRGALLGGLLMTANKKLVAAAALLLALSGTGYLAFRTFERAATPERSVASRPAAAHESAGAPDPTDPKTEDEGKKLVVRVLGERDEPIRGAEVLVLDGLVEPGPGCVAPDLWTRRWIEISRPALARGVTDESGTATFGGLTGEGWDVIARATGYCSASRSLMWGGTEEVVIRLGDPRTLSGRVLDTKGAPVPNAVVLAGDPSLPWVLGYGDPPQRAVADATGEFVLDALPARDLALFAAFPGGVTFHVATLRFPGPECFDITLERGGVLEGHVVDRDGRALPDAEIRVASWETNSKYLAAARSDATGRYVIDTLPPCTISHVVVEKPGYALDPDTAERVRTGIELREGETATLDLLLVPGATIRGLVEGPDGPVAGIRTDAWASRDTGIFVRKATADAEGRFVIDSLAPGRYVAQAYPTDGSKPEGGYVENPFKAMEETGEKPYLVDLREGEVREHVIRIVRGDRVVEGVVLGPDGRPFPDAYVAAKGCSTRTAEDGSFRLEHVFADADFVVAFASGYQQVQPKPAVAPSGVVVRFEAAPPDPKVVGTVRGPSGDVPKGAYVLFAVEEGYGGPLYKNLLEERLWYKATRYPVGADGGFEFVLPKPRPGKFWLRAAAPGFAAGPPVEMAPEEAKDVYEAQLTIAVAQSLRGVVVDEASGKPVPHARVSVRRPRPAYWVVVEEPLGTGDAVAAVTDALGTFRVDELAEGWWEVAANAPGYVEGVAKHELPSGGVVRVSLARTLAIAGTVTYPDGSPVAGAFVYTSPSKPQGQRRYTSCGRKTAADGSFESEGLEPGEYRVSIKGTMLGEPNIVATEVTPVAAGTRDLRVVVERGLSITGTVVDSDGHPVRLVDVAAQPEGQGRICSAQSTYDGTFSIFSLRDGSYTLRFTKQGDDAIKTTRTGVRAGARDLRIEVAAAPRALAIEGVLVDDGGMPLADRTVEAAPGKRARTDADGRFAIRGLEPGRKRLRLRPECNSPYLPDLGEAEAGDKGLRLVPRRGMEITGAVTLQGIPLPGAYVSAQFGEDDSAIAKTDASGSFTLGGIPESAHCILTSWGGEDLVRTGRKDVLAGAAGVKLMLTRGLEARGRVLDANGGPLVGVTVQLRQDDEMGPRFKHATTNDEGRFAVKGLAPGTHEVSVHVDFEYRPCGTVEAGTMDAEVRVPK